MKLWSRYGAVIRENWHHGFTCFGGPAVQFQTFHEKFVNRLEWIDEPRYQQIFCLSQSLPGSASVKMLFCINSIHCDMVAGGIATVLFCVPGAIGMFGLALGISHVGNTLPRPVYALLSGLNAATVGIIALAGVRLAGRAITDKITRIWVCLGGVMGMLYTALWYYPVILVGAGFTTYLIDMRYPQRVYAFVRRVISTLHRQRSSPSADPESQQKSQNLNPSPNLEKPLPAVPRSPPSSARTDQGDTSLETSWIKSPSQISTTSLRTAALAKRLPVSKSDIQKEFQGIPTMSWQLGTSIIALFLLTFILVIALSHMLTPTRLLSLFSSLYQAGTIIVGGGPVVIPLLEDYIVNPGWVSSRDFLLGLAVIQAFPGPNFNFAIYLGTLAVSSDSLNSPHLPPYLGAVVAFIGMYGPGFFIMVGFMGLWRLVSGRPWFEAVLRGVNAAAVGLVFTAVWKLWQLGDFKEGSSSGSPLGNDPWLVGITGLAYVGGAWFGVSPPIAILAGGALGVGKWAALNAAH